MNPNGEGGSGGGMGSGGSAVMDRPSTVETGNNIGTDVLKVEIQPSLDLPPADFGTSLEHKDIRDVVALEPADVAVSETPVADTPEQAVVAASNPATDAELNEASQREGPFPLAAAAQNERDIAAMNQNMEGLVQQGVTDGTNGASREAAPDSQTPRAQINPTEAQPPAGDVPSPTLADTNPDLAVLGAKLATAELDQSATNTALTRGVDPEINRGNIGRVRDGTMTTEAWNALSSSEREAASPAFTAEQRVQFPADTPVAAEASVAAPVVAETEPAADPSSAVVEGAATASAEPVVEDPLAVEPPAPAAGEGGGNGNKTPTVEGADSSGDENSNPDEGKNSSGIEGVVDRIKKRRICSKHLCNGSLNVSRDQNKSWRRC